MKEILTVAKENQFAVGAFNVADSTFLTLISVIFSQNKPTPRHFNNSNLTNIPNLEPLTRFHKNIC